MIGSQIRSELHRPLDGDRRFVARSHGVYLVREHPEHLAHVMSEKARLRAEEDVFNYRRLLTMTRNAIQFA